MANVRGRRTINEVQILETDSNPNTGTGADAPVGSLALVDSTKSVWLKTGVSDTTWELQFDANVNNSQKVSYNANHTPNYIEWFRSLTQSTGNRAARTDFTYDSSLSITSEVFKYYDTNGTTVVLTLTSTYYYLANGDLNYVERVFS